MVTQSSSPHLNAVEYGKHSQRNVCEACVRSSADWGHLRTCQTGAVISCCAGVPDHLATRQARLSGHPVVASVAARRP